LGRKTGEGFYKYGPGNYEFVKLEKVGNIGVLRLNRPRRANALNMTFLKEIDNALTVLEEDDEVRVVVVIGEGKNFCAGADISMFASGRPELVTEFSQTGHKVFRRIEMYPKPVIAAIHGAAVGGGFELALACDLRVMSKKAFLGLPELNLGIIPGWGGTQRLAYYVGVSKLKEIVLLKKNIDAETAKNLGLVAEVFPEEDFMEKVIEFAKNLTELPPVAVKYLKKVITLGTMPNLETGCLVESEASGDIALTQDVAEGIQAFNYHRKPKFVGR
ncbi:MAG: enoyl-CoA hydratase-related protein, partial [Archaeoglobaceae archaeon]